MKPDLDIRRACKLLGEYDYSDEAVLLDEAPRMVRMLLALEWIGDGGGTPICGACNVAKYGPRGIDNDHHANCEWLAVMRRLGERPL